MLPAGLASADPAAWRVTGRNGGEVTLLGSMHVMRPSDHPLPASIDALVERADLIVMELDLDDIDAAAQQRLILETAMLPQGTVLADVVDDEVYRLVEQHMRELGVDLAQLERFEPWFLAITLLDLGMRKIGFQAERGVEQYVLGRAQAAGKEIVGLETLEFQIGIFDALPPEQQQAMLEQTLARARRRSTVLGEMVAAWRDGELESLSAELLDEFDRVPGALRDARDEAQHAPGSRRSSACSPTGAAISSSSVRCTSSAPTASSICSRERGHDVERAAVAVFTGRGSDLDHLEVFFAGAAIGAAPRERNVGPFRARRDPFVGPAFGFVVDEAADETHVFLHVTYPPNARCIFRASVSRAYASLAPRGLIERRGQPLEPLTGIRHLEQRLLERELSGRSSMRRPPTQAASSNDGATPR